MLAANPLATIASPVSAMSAWSVSKYEGLVYRNIDLATCRIRPSPFLKGCALIMRPSDKVEAALGMCAASDGSGKWT